MITHIRRCLLVLAFITRWCTFLTAQETDTVLVDVTLEEVVVKGSRNDSPITLSAGNSIVFNFRKSENLPKLFGFADPLRYVQMLPGIQTNSEIQGGIHIQGCDNSHNDITIMDVPIYNACHLFGFFSVFNAAHYGTMEINKSVKNASSSNRLGGQLILSSKQQVHDSTDFAFSTGLLSSEGTARIRISPKTCLTASARVSYINLLYSKWLSFDDFNAKYSFYDANFTLIHDFDRFNSVCLDYFGGRDDGTFITGKLDSRIFSRWGNQMAAVRYIHDRHNGFKLENNTYFTSYRNNLSIDAQSDKIFLPSAISDYGNKTKVKWKGLTGGLDISVHDIHPQNIDGTYMWITGSSLPETVTLESSLYLDYRLFLSDYFYLDGGIRGSVYGSGQTGWFWGMDPSISAGYDNQSFSININYFLRHQYLFQTGFTNLGLPTEFWCSSNDYFQPQYAHSIALNFSCHLFDYMFRISGDLFYKRMFNQIEYTGSIYDLIGRSYNPYDSIIQGKGKNYGGSVSLNKCSGQFTGWLSYSYTRAERSFPAYGMSGSYPASYERPHQINAVVTYTLGEHWDFGLTFVYASGTPFTAPKCISLINSNIILSYGEHNANRLTPYYRLDMSVNFKWKAKHLKENGLNLSVYNMTCHKNNLFYTVRKDGSDIVYRPVTFFTSILPSVSYFFKF